MVFDSRFSRLAFSVLSLGYEIDVIRISGTSLDCSELGPLHAYDSISQFSIQIVDFVIEFSDFVERCSVI